MGYYRYSPHGQTTVVNNGSSTLADADPFRYVGGYQDKTSTGDDGFYKLGARYYDGRGHFTQPDAIAGSISDPRTLTSYNYAGGDPINNSDPSGYLSVGDVVGGVVGTAVGVAGGAAICAATGGLGCVVGAIGYGAIGGGLGAAIKGEIDGTPAGDRPEQFRDGALLGGITAFVGKIFGG